MRPVHQCINPTLETLCREAMQLEALNDLVLRFLPESLQPYCQVGSFQKGTLILLVQDSVWASQLRYSLPDIRDALRKDGGIYQLTSIKITLMMPEIMPQTTKKKVILSSQAREVIISGAKECTGALQQALYRLARPHDDSA